MSVTKERYPYIDIARALSIALLVLGHTLGYSTHCKLLYKLIYGFVVPLFFLVSGYITSQTASPGAFLRSRLRRIVVPYFIWAFLFLIPYFLLGGVTADVLNMQAEDSLPRLIVNIFYGIGKDGALRHNSTLWFLPALFTIELCYRGIVALARRCPKGEPVLLAVLLLVGYGVGRYWKIPLPWGINTMLVAGPFFFVGYLLRKYSLIPRLATWRWRWAVYPLLVALWAVTSSRNSLLAFMSYYYGNPLLGYVSGISMSVFVLCMSYHIGSSRVLEYVGRNTLSIMLFHKLVVLVFQTKAGPITAWLKNSNAFVEVLLSMVIAALAIGCSLIGAEVLRRAAPVTIGEPPRRKTRTRA